MKTLFTAEATNVGGRDGHVSSRDKKIDLDVATPEALGGASSRATNPEQLFAAGYSACLNGALMNILQKSRVSHGQTSVTAKVSLLEDPKDQGFKLGVKLEVHVEGLDQNKAEKYAHMAHEFCPYSKAIRDQVSVTLAVTSES